MPAQHFGGDSARGSQGIPTTGTAEVYSVSQGTGARWMALMFSVSPPQILPSNSSPCDKVTLFWSCGRSSSSALKKNHLLHHPPVRAGFIASQGVTVRWALLCSCSIPWQDTAPRQERGNLHLVTRRGAESARKTLWYFLLYFK